MSNKSSGPAQTIALPKGGGALHGIGEKFSPDLHTGTGNFSVPIAVPPGRNGFQPQLNLVYSTGKHPPQQISCVAGEKAHLTFAPGLGVIHCGIGLAQQVVR